MEDQARFVKLSDIEPKDLIPNAVARFIHTDHMTLAYWEFEPGSTLGKHSHPHEQVTNAIEGTFELTVNGVPYRLEPGTACVIPPHAEHSGRAITQCTLIDVFYPVREDYR
ncbi:MAG: cupin domain-containing protein [Anaerolineae bacterium]|jgi:quercetin dioxygenase-like cupin family protein